MITSIKSIVTSWRVHAPHRIYNFTRVSFPIQLYRFIESLVFWSPWDNEVKDLMDRTRMVTHALLHNTRDKEDTGLSVGMMIIVHKLYSKCVKISSKKNHLAEFS